jgi:hypothetical protein
MDTTMNHRNELSILVKLFLCAFLYAVFAMVFSRVFVIPHVISSINGHITGDPYLYHLIGLEKAEEIRTMGINKFEFHPKGQGPAGIASLIYLIWENPYSMVLFNAVLHGISVLMVVMILRRWFSWRISIIAALPLVISPYMMVWYSQINKDSFNLAGGLLFTYGLLKLVSPKEKSPSYYNARLALFIIATGIALTWMARPYVNQILLPITSLILVIALLLRVMRDRDRGGVDWFCYMRCADSCMSCRIRERSGF